MPLSSYSWPLLNGLAIWKGSSSPFSSTRRSVMNFLSNQWGTLQSLRVKRTPYAPNTLIDLMVNPTPCLTKKDVSVGVHTIPTFPTVKFSERKPQNWPEPSQIDQLEQQKNANAGVLPHFSQSIAEYDGVLCVILILAWFFLRHFNFNFVSVWNFNTFNTLGR